MRTLDAIAFDYGLAVAAAVVAARADFLPVTMLAVLVIGSRQHALLVLMHDGAHGLLCRNSRVNDWLSRWLLAWPLGVSFDGYRASHLRHHHFLGTAHDPDAQDRAHDPAWRFPRTRRQLTASAAFELCGFGALVAVRDHALKHALFVAHRLTCRAAPRPGARWLHVAFMTGALWAFDAWSVWAVWWVLPAATYLQFVLRFRSTAEHYGTRDGAIARDWEPASGVLRWLLAPHGVGRHRSHHAVPTLPWWRVTRTGRPLGYRVRDLVREWTSGAQGSCAPSPLVRDASHFR